MIVSWEEPDPPLRTAGALNVRPHLRPQPTERDWKWSYSPRPSGRFDVTFVPTEEVDEWEIVGEA